eukprot:Skav207354  [mRNA]  locus=scaffold426:170746:173934:- [translate_table: standard]
MLQAAGIRQFIMADPMGCLEHVQAQRPAGFMHRVTGSVAARISKGKVVRTEENPGEATTFQLMLRRADNVPVGLHVQGWAGGVAVDCPPCTRQLMSGEDGLLVEKILPGGAIEAWNKQCPGEIREIRPGDSIPGMAESFEEKH